jgi:hypothetical protein
VNPAVDPKCHPPNGPIQCGSAGEELTPFGVTLELRTQSSNAHLWTVEASRVATPHLSAFLDQSFVVT